MSELKTIEVIAGYNPAGQPIIERLDAFEQEAGQFRITNTPVFTGIAKLDLIELTGDAGEFKVLERSGNLSIRVISKANVTQIIDALRGEIEKHDGEIENITDRFFTISCHVSVGFGVIETLLNETLAGFSNSAWAYNNVFCPESSEPLNWWVDILNEQ